MKQKKLEMPTLDVIEAEVDRMHGQSRFRTVLRSTFFSLIVVAAVAVLVATIWMPVLQIFGSSMSPTLQEGEIVISIKGTEFQQGDLVAFYLGNNILVKRYIAGPGQWVDMDEEGNVFVDGVLLDEPYIQEKSLGNANLDFPYQVPENRYFCMGDYRATSVDSRHTQVGCVAQEQIVGKIVFRIWPLEKLGKVGP